MPAATAQYAKRKEASRKRQAAMSKAGRDIGHIPPIADPARRAKGRYDLFYFCETYFPVRFDLAWSDDQLDLIAQLERAALRGLLKAEAEPRGSGKTAIMEVGCVWAIVYAHHRFVAGLAASKDKAGDILESIQIEFLNNPLLAADFPEICYPLREIAGQSNRCNGQHHNGRRTYVTWTKYKMILPTIQGSKASGAILTVGGLTGGNVRGMKHTLVSGEVIRPSLVFIDDPQTDDTAKSATQCAAREKLLQGAVLGMAGPGKPLAAFMACTVIQPGDMADNILDRIKHPDWNGSRKKMVYAFPKNEKLWDEYARLRAEGLRADDEGAAATAFYRKNRKAMDAGAVVAWEANFKPDEISAIQHAMNLKLRDEEVFYAEYQNEPIDHATDVELLTADDIAAKVNGLARGAFPTACSYLTMFTDVHDKLLYWGIMAWEPNFTGYLIDYGTYPDQRRRYFTMRSARRTLARVAQGTGRNGAIYAGLQALTGEQFPQLRTRADGAAMQVGFGMIDVGWEPDAINPFITQYPNANLFPHRGLPVTAATRPWEERKPAAGEYLGTHWRIAPYNGKAKGQIIFSNVNWWKTFVHQRLAVSLGDPGCISLYGRRRTDGTPASPAHHRMLSEHLTAEYRIQTQGWGRQVDEWKNKPSKPDNHLFDVIVGNAIAASRLGVVLNPELITPAPKATTAKKRKTRVSYMKA